MLVKRLAMCVFHRPEDKLHPTGVVSLLEFTIVIFCDRYLIACAQACGGVITAGVGDKIVQLVVRLIGIALDYVKG